jgi:hypothetical protein
MDPNTVLVELRSRLTGELPKCYDTSDWAEYYLEIREQWSALDEWLSKGGFPPDDWRHAAVWACDESN